MFRTSAQWSQSGIVEEKGRCRKSQNPGLGIRVVKCRPKEHRPDFVWSVFGQRLFRQTRVARDRKTVAGSSYMFRRFDSGLGPNCCIERGCVCVTLWLMVGRPS